MTRRVLWIVALLMAACAAAALGNVPPTMEDRYVTTVQDTPVTFELRAQDEDIDPNDPSVHPLRFVLVAGPENGVLIGELTEVHYEGPHDAVVELTYAPAAGFVGTDRATLQVIDPYDATASGTVTIEIDVTARRAEGILSGNWSMHATWESQSGSFTAFATQLTEVYRIGALTMKGVAQVRKANVGGVNHVVFDSLRFDGDLDVGPLSLASTLAFDPDAPSAAELFDHWRVTSGFKLQGLSARHTFYLAQPITSSYQTLTVQASLGSLSVSNTVRIDMDEGCGFAFSRNDATVGWRTCDLNLSASLGVSCDGFEQARFAMTGLPVSAWIPGLMLDASLTFTEEAKTLAMSVSWRPVTSGCMRLYSELETSGTHDLTLDGFTIYGLRMECRVGDVTVVSATSLDRNKNATMTGQTDYWEVLRLSGTLMGCCEAPGSWGIATYFANDSGQLFDWGMTTARFDLAADEHLNANVDLAMRSGELGDPKVEISFGFVVRW